MTTVMYAWGVYGPERRSVKRIMIRVSNAGAYGAQLQGPEKNCSGDEFIQWVQGIVSLAPEEYRKYVRFTFSGYSDDRMNAGAYFFAYYYRTQTAEEAEKEQADILAEKQRKLANAEFEASRLRRELAP